MKAFALAVFVLIASSASAQDTAFRASMVAAIAAHGADLATTENCLGAGRCTEMNQFLLRFQQPGVFGAVKMGIAALQLWGVAKLHETHPVIAQIANWSTAGIFAGIAVHNARVSR